MRRYHEAGVSVTRIAEMWRCHRRRVNEALAEMRERMGPEKRVDRGQLVRSNFRTVASETNS